MATTPQNEEPGFEHDQNELPEDHGSTSETTLEDGPEEEDAADMEDVQEETAEERKEGGYQ
ncbi:hypothetical protein RZN05_02410 [Sphingomonas sp. HF-S4]|uniref:Uncharacterized protein n=1 Tax=Sphingomonas agrestis TaxID=3080540 RepID=A0ABU3Y347_9SPHN|nr:hypothetical protein [Sphingomonas sp. HF-S4]MDV3455822.1 hypothetical protein [Sphingomonas sp. HF-S4]